MEGLVRTIRVPYLVALFAMFLMAIDVFGVASAMWGVVVTYLSGGFAFGSLSWVLKLESTLTVASAVAAFILIGERATPNTYGL